MLFMGQAQRAGKLPQASALEPQEAERLGKHPEYEGDCLSHWAARDCRWERDGPLLWAVNVVVDLGWKQESSLGKGSVSMLSPVSHDAEASCEGAGVHSRFGLHWLHTGNPAAGGEAAKSGILSDECSAGESGGAVSVTPMNQKPLAEEQPVDPSHCWEALVAFLGAGDGSGQCSRVVGSPGAGASLFPDRPGCGCWGDGLCLGAGGTGAHCRLSGGKDSQSSWEANMSRHGNQAWKHHQNVSNEGN